MKKSSASSRSLQTQQKPRVTEAQHNAEKHFLLNLYITSVQRKKINSVFE